VNALAVTLYILKFAFAVRYKKIASFIQDKTNNPELKAENMEMKTLSLKNKNISNQIDLLLKQKSIRLRNLLVSKRAIRGLSQQGTSLNTGSLVDSYIAALNNAENHDRFETHYLDSQVNCAFSFALDFSGSMQLELKDTSDLFQNTNRWKSLLLLLDSLVRLSESMHVQSTIGIVNVGPESNLGTEKITKVLVLKEAKQKWSQHIFSSFWQKKPCTGTHIVEYALASIDMVRQMNAKYRVAFFLTDGDDHIANLKYLKSIKEQAQLEGIYLFGISFAADGSIKVLEQALGDRIVACHNPIQIADILFETLEKAIKNK
jgi:hypothetical protein